eukprot:COSAG02_NODE_7047_length_3212_cov_1.654674_3_plen_86_part_00
MLATLDHQRTCLWPYNAGRLACGACQRVSGPSPALYYYIYRGGRARARVGVAYARVHAHRQRAGKQRVGGCLSRFGSQQILQKAR